MNTKYENTKNTGLEAATLYLKNPLYFSCIQTIPRALVSDILPTITTVKADIFIKNIDDMAISWNLFFDPLSTNSWVILITISVAISSALSIVQRLLHSSSYNKEHSILKYLTNFWIALKANFGGKSDSIEKSHAHREGKWHHN